MGICLLELRANKRWSLQCFCQVHVAMQLTNTSSLFGFEVCLSQKHQHNVHMSYLIVPSFTNIEKLHLLFARNSSKQTIDFDESSYFVFDSCFNNLRSIFVSLNKCNQLKAKLSTRVSPSYRLFCDN
jgi:hypothetical protein